MLENERRMDDIRRKAAEKERHNQQRENRRANDLSIKRNEQEERKQRDD